MEYPQRRQSHSSCPQNWRRFAVLLAVKQSWRSRFHTSTLSHVQNPLSSAVQVRTMSLIFCSFSSISTGCFSSFSSGFAGGGFACLRFGFGRSMGSFCSGGGRASAAPARAACGCGSCGVSDSSEGGVPGLRARGCGGVYLVLSCLCLVSCLVAYLSWGDHDSDCRCWHDVLHLDVVVVLLVASSRGRSRQSSCHNSWSNARWCSSILSPFFSFDVTAPLGVGVLRSLGSHLGMISSAFSVFLGLGFSHAVAEVVAGTATAASSSPGGVSSRSVRRCLRVLFVVISLKSSDVFFVFRVPVRGDRPSFDHLSNGPLFGVTQTLLKAPVPVESSDGSCDVMVSVRSSYDVSVPSLEEGFDTSLMKEGDSMHFVKDVLWVSFAGVL